VPLISDGEYQYEYNDFLKAIGPLNTSQSSGYSFDLIDNMAPRSAAEANDQQTQGVKSLTVGSGQPQQPLTQDQNDSIDATKYLSATPPTVTPPPAPTKSPVKIATPQYVNFQDDISRESPDFLKMLYFEQINGAMLLSLTNNANLNTESINYQPIIDMAEIQKALDPKGILALQNTSDKYFLNFPIKLETKIPNYGNGPSGSNVYINFSTGNLVIESINLNPGEKIEIETLQNGTIYETDLGVDEL